MKLLKYFFYKIKNKFNKNLNGGKYWGDLNHDIIERTPVKHKFTYKADGWDLVVNNYTKCDVLENDHWFCECYEGDNGYDYIISQVSSDIYFLWWKVVTLYSMVSIMKVTKEWMEDRNAMNYIYDFTNHGSSNSLPNISDYSRQCRKVGGHIAFIGQSPCDYGYDYLIFDDHMQENFHNETIAYIDFD